MTQGQKLKVFTFLLTILALINFDPILLAISALFGWFLTGIAAEALYHRKISHRHFEYKNKIIEYLSYVIMIISGQGTPLGWAVMHRTHHAKTDTMEDPQSHHSVGKARTMTSWYSIDNPNTKMVSDIFKDRHLMFLHNHYNKLFLIYTAILFIISPIICLYFAGVSVVVCDLSVGIVNTFGHGNQINADGHYARNMVIGERFLWGEGHHYNHHIDPSSPIFGKNDWGYYFVKLLGKPRV